MSLEATAVFQVRDNDKLEGRVYAFNLTIRLSMKSKVIYVPQVTYFHRIMCVRANRKAE